MVVCILDRDSKVVLHANMKASPEPLAAAIALYRDDLVISVEFMVQFGVYPCDKPAYNYRI